MSTEIISAAQRRIREIRMKDVELFVLSDGRPVQDACVHFRMKNHQFLFGAVCYSHGLLANQEQEDRFTRYFRELFNYSMVAYHWANYEPRRGVYREPYTRNLVDWADEIGIKKKLHALIWHEVCPEWLKDGEVEAEYTRRISHLMQTYGDRFDFFDLANETTVNDRFDNPVSRWIHRYGPMNMMKFGTKLVRSYKPDAKLLYGDWNVHGEEYFNFLREMRENDIDIDIIGLQSHMHRDKWTQEETLRVMDRAAQFGWPIHFPECSVMSGKPVGYMEYSANAVNRYTEEEEDLYFQADFSKEFYTLVFSHPAVEALSWFDFTDHRWLGAPAGLVDDDVRPKPVYNALRKLIHEEWHSDEDAITNEYGVAKARLFCGNYDIIVETETGEKVFNRDVIRESFYAGGGAPRRLVVKI